MSEIKRVPLCTFEPPKVSEKPCKKKLKTVRISLILPESNEDKCPEYNYKDELAAVKKRVKQKETNNVPNGLDPFDEDDADVRRIALQMEEKYGTGVGGVKKKRKGRKDDYADIGMGYDESDSFIDNTDGYDEIIPQNVTTLHGGFYINSGALEFKTDDEASSDFSSSDSETDTNEKPRGRKRVLESSDEESERASDIGPNEKKPKLQNSMAAMPQIKKKLFGHEKILAKKKKLLDPAKKTVKELLREKRYDLNMSTAPDGIIGDGNKETIEKDALKENKKPMNITSVTDAIESVVKATIIATPGKVTDSGSQISLDVNKKEFNYINPSATQSSLESDSSQNEEKVEVVKLPENLPAEILEVINEIKKAAAENKDGKVKFFNDEVNKLLLSLERKCKCLGKPSKTKVYEHLSAFVRCKKETLLKRAKNLVLEDEEKRLKKLLGKLKEEVDKVMPMLMDTHQKESQKVLQRKFSQESVDNEETKGLRMPKRRFQWSEEAKKYLKDILSIKRRCLLLEGKQKELLEEQMTQFLKASVQLLWPDGWMSMAALTKMCNILIENSRKSLNSTTKSTSSSQEKSKHSQINNNSFNQTTNNNLSIIPISSSESKGSSKSDSIINELTVSKIVSSSSPPEKTEPVSHVTVKAGSSVPVMNTEEKTTSSTDLNVFRHSPDLLIKPVDTSVIVTPNTHHSSKAEVFTKPFIEPIKTPSPPIQMDVKHPQVIDLSDLTAIEKVLQKDIRQPENIAPLRLTKDVAKDYTEINKATKPPPEMNSFPLSHPSMEFAGIPSEGDEIQKVMEDLKALQKLSSPVKSAENSTGSPVSVIAFNKNFAHRPNQSSAPQRTDFSSGFQDEFQKQLLHSLNHMTSSSSKSNYNRCS